MRVLVLTAALCLTALSNGHQPVRFVHPKRTIVLAGPGGTDVLAQAFVVRDPANRAFRLEWTGEACGGATSKELDGEYASALQPIQPIRVRVGTGVCSFAAAVFGAGGKVRAIARLELRVCGGEESCS